MMKKEFKFMLLGIELALIGLVFLFLEGHTFKNLSLFGIAGLILPCLSVFLFFRGFSGDFKDKS